MSASFSTEPTVAVVDIGSNTIKLLVAARADHGAVITRYWQTEETRLGSGIDAAKPRLADEAMRRGIESIQTLLAAAAPYAPRAVVLVATSAVRDAENGSRFQEAVREATGHTLRILTGTEEAHFIGRGLAADPALTALQDFYVFDLGGGSLECLRFEGRVARQSLSLQLGSVRLMERCAGGSPHWSEAVGECVQTQVRSAFAASGFAFSLPTGSPAVFCGGAMTTTRAVSAAAQGRSLEESAARVRRDELETHLRKIGPLSLEERRRIPGLPGGRADIFPVALATMIEVARLGNFEGFNHSFYTLRFGLAAELLEGTV